MASNDSSATLPNPFTPLAFLPPDVANELEISRYILAAVVGAWLWDFFVSINEEYRMFFKSRVALSDIVYILARCLSLAFILCSLIFLTGPVGDCKQLAVALGWCFGIGMPMNSLLFFFRVRAVFHKNKNVVIFFGFLWLCTFTCIASPFAIVDAIHVGTSSICVETNVKSYGPVGIVITAFFDTLVYLAISVRLTMNSLAYTNYTWRELIKIFFGGRGMGNVSRTLLTSGQSYYLVTVGMNIISMVLIFSPAIPAAIKVCPANLDIALQNAMACRVYRQLKLGLISENSIHSWYNSGTGGQPKPPGVPMTSLQFNQTKCPRCQCTTVDTTRMTTGGVDIELTGGPEIDVKIGARNRAYESSTEEGADRKNTPAW